MKLILVVLLMVAGLVFVSALANIHENKKQPQDAEDIKVNQFSLCELVFFLTFAVFPSPPVCYNASLNFQHIFEVH